MNLPRHARNLIRKSSIIVPSKPLRGFSVHVPSSAGPSGTSWNTYHAAQVVTGMDLLRIYSSGDVNVHPVTSFQEFLQHPNYADEGTRLQSFKHWCGVIPATELADAGLYMVAHDTVKCYSCRVVIQGWKQEDKPIDIHCLYNSNCDFVKNYILKLSEIDDLHNMASRNLVGRLNHYGERPVIKERIKDNSYSSTKPITIRDSKSPQVPCYQATEVIHPACQWSVSTYGHLAKGSNANTSDDTMSTPPSEKMIMVSLLVSLLVSMNSYNFYTVVPVATHLCVISL